MKSSGRRSMSIGERLEHKMSMNKYRTLTTWSGVRMPKELASLAKAREMHRKELGRAAPATPVEVEEAADHNATTVEHEVTWRSSARRRRRVRLHAATTAASLGTKCKIVDRRSAIKVLPKARVRANLMRKEKVDNEDMKCKLMKLLQKRRCTSWKRSMTTCGSCRTNPR